MGVSPYYADESVTLFCGDCREVADWLAADVLVTDPPYGRRWSQGRSKNDGRHADDSRPGIAGDEDTSVRDDALGLWSPRMAVAFGDLMLPPPAGTRQVLAYRKAVDSGTKGAMGGFRRDIEAVYLIGAWPGRLGGRSSVVTSGTPLTGGAHGVTARYGHPHAKPLDVMETLIAACPPGVIADPFAGSGSTLVAARNLGRKVVGVELEERYCELAARRLSQMVLEAG